MKINLNQKLELKKCFAFNDIWKTGVNLRLLSTVEFNCKLKAFIQHEPHQQSENQIIQL